MSYIIPSDDETESRMTIMDMIVQRLYENANDMPGAYTAAYNDEEIYVRKRGYNEDEDEDDDMYILTIRLSPNNGSRVSNDSVFPDNEKGLYPEFLFDIMSVIEGRRNMITRELDDMKFFLFNFDHTVDYLNGYINMLINGGESTEFIKLNDALGFGESYRGYPGNDTRRGTVMEID